MEFPKKTKLIKWSWGLPKKKRERRNCCLLCCEKKKNSFICSVSMSTFWFATQLLTDCAPSSKWTWLHLHDSEDSQSSLLEEKWFLILKTYFGIYKFTDIQLRNKRLGQRVQMARLEFICMKFAQNYFCSETMADKTLNKPSPFYILE